MTRLLTLPCSGSGELGVETSDGGDAVAHLHDQDGGAHLELAGGVRSVAGREVDLAISHGDRNVAAAFARHREYDAADGARQLFVSHVDGCVGPA